MTHQEQLTIPFSAIRDLSQMQSQDFLYSLFTSEKTLYNLILKYEYGRGKLENLRIDRQSVVVTDSTKGKFIAYYDLHEFSLCAAVDYFGKEHMTVHYVINPASQSITLTGEYRPERLDEL